jgi:hypothetical protein
MMTKRWPSGSFDRAVGQTLTLQHTIEAVWAAITDPEQRANWFGIATWEESHGDYKQRLVVPQRITACCLQSSRALDSNDPGLHRGD